MEDKIKELISKINNNIFIFDKVELNAHEQVVVRAKPKNYILLALELLKLTNNKIIVEIGGLRQHMTHSIEEFNPICCNDGHSTEFWCSNKDLKVYSIDINPNCVQFYDSLKKKSNNLNYFIQDGIQFIKDFDKEIDLLFLDAWDVHYGSPYAEKHLEAYEVAKDKLSKHHIISIDDTDIANGGKGQLLIPHLLNNNYKLIVSGRQTILTNFNIGN
jgi:hypothetical protein